MAGSAMWPVQSRWNQYSACRSLIGRDSMRVRSMPRTASSVSSPSSEPGRFWVVAASVVRSRPVGAGGGPGGARSTKRVTAPGLSATSSARISRPNCAAASGAQTAASISPRDTCAAASLVDVLTRTSACGRFRAIQLRVCAMPWLCEATVRTWSSVVPGRTIAANRTGSTDLLDDHQRRVVEQPVEHRRHRALDAVLDRHAAGVGPPVPDRREHGRIAGTRHELRTLGLRQREQGLLGEGRVRAEERQSGHGRRA